MRIETLLGASAERHPKRIAIWQGERSITYEDLLERVDATALALTDRGVTPGDRVVIWTRKSIETVAVMYACLRLGAVYVPVAPNNPPSRARMIADAAGAALVVVDETHAGVEFGQATAIVTELHNAPIADPLPIRDSTDELAYVLFTSGSTGTPKGVAITHASAMAFILWSAKAAELSEHDRLSSHSAFNFDLSVFDIFGACAASASVDLLSEEASYLGAALVEYMTQRGITVWYSVPSVIGLILSETTDAADLGSGQLRRMVLAGERIDPAKLHQLAALLPNTQFANWYGPTETNVVAAYDIPRAEIDASSEVPIGYAASGAALILGDADTDGHRSLTVAGPTVMRGYWGSEILPSPRFDTGDLVRGGPNGSLVYVGRADAQVKVRGYRVDLGEIEAVLRLHEKIRDVAVLAVDPGPSARLVAFVEPPQGSTPPGLLDIKRQIAAHLPPYMTVDAREVVESLPLTANGKRNDRALRDYWARNREGN